MYATPIRNGRRPKMGSVKVNDRAKSRPLTVGNSNRLRTQLPVMKRTGLGVVPN